MRFQHNSSKVLEPFKKIWYMVYINTVTNVLKYTSVQVLLKCNANAIQN